MKRIVAANANKVNKVKLRQQFIKLATDIRDLSKYEFVALLKADTDTAVQWIDRLQALYDEFEQEARSFLQYYCVKVLVNGQFIGYLADVKYTSTPNYYYASGDRTIQVTSDIEEAKPFATTNAANIACGADGEDILVLLEDGTGYQYANVKIKLDPSAIGTLSEYQLKQGRKVEYVDDISFEVIEL